MKSKTCLMLIFLLLTGALTRLMLILMETDYMTIIAQATCCGLIINFFYRNNEVIENSSDNNV